MKQSSLTHFLYPRRRYHGQWTPDNFLFNANLQEFSDRVSYICNLETNGKIAPDDAYQQIRALWKQLKSARQQLRSGGNNDLSSQ